MSRNASTQPEVLVLGAGAAGIFAALSAARSGADVTLVEKTDRLGTKILISGGGKCNITHGGTVETMLKAFRANEAKFLRPSFYRFTNEQAVEVFTASGLEVYEREDGRIFPIDRTAKDVVAILDRLLEEAGINVIYDEPVTGLEVDEGALNKVKTTKRTFEPGYTILAVGGSSYPKTGTTGDGYAWARSIGHKVERVRSALAPIDLDGYGQEHNDKATRSGVALRDCVLRARAGGKEIAKWRGDLLFTHRGISGPTALGISRIVAEHYPPEPVDLEVDLAPDQDFESLRLKLIDLKSKLPKRLAWALIHGIVPQSLQDDLLLEAKIDPSLALQFVTAKQVNILAANVKAWKIGSVRSVPLEKGEVVAGGVSLDEVDPKTMESLIVQRLALCGEVLDIAGPVGGYNLQAAFSTGIVAGETAALSVRS